jgi:7-carboxy-7-deazaguanine synthase (Cx14CxxC type)
MTYLVNEMFYSLQGEGAQSGRAAVFCRFSGCNLSCSFCDTDHSVVGGEFESADDLAMAALEQSDRATMVVCTGGEPLLQLDDDAVLAFQIAGFQVAVETNGTLPLPRGVDWICVSPKANAELRQVFGHELKLVYPQPGVNPVDYQSLDFDHFYLQPMSGNVKPTVEYCMKNPQWKLSLQTHKLIGVR